MKTAITIPAAALSLAFGCATKPSVVGIWTTPPGAHAAALARTYVFEQNGQATLITVTRDGIRTTRNGSYTLADGRLTLDLLPGGMSPASHAEYHVETKGRTLTLRSDSGPDELVLTKQ